ncbi:ABC transporter substrate-binding protein [Streptomyces sp. NPDC020807]|uniref:ABC transporter substrate-binding protein n=1 Tax=Streptomyces sp. NPDC020807 TaxID=3155119 RepID=UPI0033F60199
MSGAQPWAFTDDRGVESVAARVPERVVAYVRAGAALLDLGVAPVGVYGSGHDGAGLDPAKAGRLGDAGVPYLGGGRGLDEGVLREARPDLVVDVTYDGKGPYALDEAVVERLGIPLVALSVGNELSLPGILGRFDALAGSLRGGPAAGAGSGSSGLADAEDVLREAAGRSALSVLALSGGGSGQVHLARPAAWPELVRLAALGVRLVDPGPGAGVNWLTTDWGRVGELRPDVVLFDNRAHAAPPGSYGIPDAARLVPWNPETPPSPDAYARFFRGVAEYLAS